MYYIFYKKNIGMLPSKIAYEVLRISQSVGLKESDRVIILGVSTHKFNDLRMDYKDNATIREDCNTDCNTDCNKVITTMCIKTNATVNIKL